MKQSNCMRMEHEKYVDSDDLLSEQERQKELEQTNDAGALDWVASEAI